MRNEREPEPTLKDFIGPVVKNRYCGSKNRHEPHVTPMLGRENEVVFNCRGKV